MRNEAGHEVRELGRGQVMRILRHQVMELFPESNGEK